MVPANPLASSWATATVDDAVACYRLLLGRAPDPEGLSHYRQRVSSGAMTVADLVGEFLGSVEFTRGHPGLRTPGAALELASTVEGFSMHVDASDYAVGHTVARTGRYEPEVSAVVRSLLRPGATFIDVGANIGWFSLLAASVVGPGGRVIAVEPNPLNVSLLRQSAKENGFDNIEVFNVALGDRPGAVALETDGSNGRIIPIDGPPAAPLEASFVVPAFSLDDLLAASMPAAVDVVKMDVEGAEPMVLRGAQGVLSTFRPVLVTEFYPLALDSSPWGNARGYLAQLRALGYRLAVIEQAVLAGTVQAGTVHAELDDEAIMAAATCSGIDHIDLLARPGG